MFQVGAASVVITPELGRPIQGATVDQVAHSIRDELEANALYISRNDTALLFVSVDVAGLIKAFSDRLRTAMAKAAGLEMREVILAGTHIHSGPSLIRTNILKALDLEYVDKLQVWLESLAREAVSTAKAGRLAYGVGAAQIGYNRRLCWADGSHSMHGDTTREDFTGCEGPVDPQHTAIFAEDEEQKLVAILHNNTAHPTCFYGADFYSADFPGCARNHLRNALGDIPVLFFNGTFGDISIENMMAPRPHGESKDQKVERAGLLLAGETLRLLHDAHFQDDFELAHRSEALQVNVRLPDKARVVWARDILKKLAEGEHVTVWDRTFAYGVVLLYDGFAGDPTDRLPIHAIRMGELALVTEPLELYCQFGLDIKRRSPVRQTAILGNCNAAEGYCPTVSGILGGGYSGVPIDWTRYTADTGARVVDCASKLLRPLWR